MKKLFGIVFLSALFIHAGAQQIKRDVLFDSDWKFYKGKADGAEKPDQCDYTWRSVALPHDWSIEDLPGTTPNTHTRIVSGPFDSKALCGKHSGFTVGGTGWYRKHFYLSPVDSGKLVYLRFDGVYMNADVWINGHHLGNHPYGYTAFTYELSKYLNYNKKENILAVEVKNEGINSRWYSGSGIYRSVHLSIVDKVHIAPDGVFVATPSVDSLRSRVLVETEVKNQSLKDTDICLSVDIIDKTGITVATKSVLTRVSRYVPSKIKLHFLLENPLLWSPETPHLYKAVCALKTGSRIIDKTETTFGIRSLLFDSEKGFFLNGKSTKLKGGAMHANNGPLGAAAFDRAEERRVERMKEAGFNTVRCGHNPPSTAFLNACDRLGLMVLNEAFDVWKIGWLPDDYHLYFDRWWKFDLYSMVMSDRNHPSVIMRSIGNQIREGRDSTGIALAYQLSGYLRTLDPTRPVSINVAMTNDWHDGSPENWKNYDPIFSAIDVCGYSYQSSQYVNVHERLPDRIQFSSEIDPKNAFRNWMRVTDHDYVVGNFTWTAMDFMGEVALGWAARESFRAPDSVLFPWMSTNSGDFDLCGFKKPRSYYRDILFKNNNKLSIFVHSPVPSFALKNDSPWGWDDVKPSWTWPGYEKKNLTVVAYSGCDSVQLLLNGKPIGTRTTSRATEFKATWEVPYEKGLLKAIGYIGGTAVEQQPLVTAGKPAKIRLLADHTTIFADGHDLSYVTVEITDKDNILNPQANQQINFDMEGEGKIIAVGNSNPTSLESFQQPTRKAYEGKCLVIIQSTDKPGKITLTASGKGLSPGKITIHAKENH